MALRTVLQYPDTRLRLKAKPVIAYDEGLRSLVADMIETMFVEQGMGLAAPQINVQSRVIVVNFSSHAREPFAVINPVIRQRSGECVHDEYCLSVPDIGIPVKRAEKITVTYFDEFGQEFTREAEGLEARCFQHEIDHLDGIVTVDYLKGLKRKLYDRKCLKLQKQLKKAQV